MKIMNTHSPSIMLIALITSILIALGVTTFALTYSGGGATPMAEAEQTAKEEALAAIEAANAPSPTPSLPPASNVGRLVPFMENGLWGYKNAKGQTVIEAKYTDAKEFDNNIAFAAEDGLYGLISRGGVWIADPQWTSVLGFSEGRAAVEKDGSWGYVDPTGAPVIDYKFREARSFHCGRAVVRSASTYGYIDMNGDMVISSKWTKANDFSEDVAFATSEAGNNYIIDKIGEKIATLGSHISGTVFCEGFAVVIDRGSHYYMNSLGTTAFKTKFEDALPFSGGLAGVKLSGKWGFITTGGVMSIDNVYSAVSSFSGGYAAVQDPTSGLWGYINRYGTMMIEPRFDAAGPFSGGFAVVSENGAYSLVDAQGALTPLYSA